MPSFVASLVADVSSTSIAFLTAVITNYWAIILSAGFVGGMIALFWRLGHKVTGR